MTAPARRRLWTPDLSAIWASIARFCVGTETRRFIFRATILAFAVRVAILAAAYLTAYVILQRENEHFGAAMLEMLKRWDANQYERIAESGYPTSGDYQELIVFFPLYPYLVRLVEYVIPSFLVAGLLISALASVVAGYFLQAIVRVDGGDDAEAGRSLWYFFLFPTAYFLVMPYTEALFMALLLGSFYFARRKQWWWAGILGGFCTASRLEGMVLLPALAVEAVHQRKWRGIDKEALFSLAIVPTGFLFFLWLNYHLHGNIFAFLDYEDLNWDHHRIWPWESIKETWLWVRSSPGFLRTSIYETRLAGTAIAAIILVIGVRWLRPSYQVFGWLALLFFLSVSYQISLPRYVLTIFPMYFVLAKLGRNLEAHQAMLTVSALLMGTLYVVYARTWGF